MLWLHDLGLQWTIFLTMKSLLHLHTHTQPFYSCLDFVQDNPGEPVPEETFTHSHLSWSSVICGLLSPSITIHGILLVQFMCLTVFFHNLCPSFLWSACWSGGCIRWHSLGTTAKQVAMVWACAVKRRRQWLGEEMYGVWSGGCEAKR